MKFKSLIIIVFLGLILLILWLFIDERNKSKRLSLLINKMKNENDKLKKSYFVLLEEFLKIQGNVGPDIITELKKLKSYPDNLTVDVHYEIDSVIKLIREGDGVKAVKDLAKIIETKLREKTSNDEKFNKQPKLHFLLEHAKNCGWIKQRSFENGMLLKQIRNEESHQLAVKKELYEIGMAIFGGIEIIYEINNIK